MRVSVNRTSIPNDDWATLEGAAMTMTNASPSVRGRRVKFTPQAIEKIKDLVAEGISRDEIANRLGVTVGSLQVTCSRLGISLRRIISARRLRAPHGRCQAGLSWHCARARAEGSIAAGSLRRACGQARDNDATSRQSAIDRYSALFSHNRDAGP